MQRPVVIVPGYYGSELVDTQADNFEWWITDFAVFHAITVLNALRLDTGDPERIVASGPLDHFSLTPFLHIGIYSKLRQYLRDSVGYTDGEIHAVGVDWRRSLTRLAVDLQQKIDAIGAPSVDVITHSHGGLVARAYLDRFGGGKVNSLITIAAPHKGMFKTWQAVHDGFQFAVFPPDHLRRTARTFPSAYELLPFDANDGFFDCNGQAADATAVPDWCETAEMRAMLGDANAVVHALSDQLAVDACFIYGTRLETVTHCKGSPTALTFTTSTDGDSTVPLLSARGNGITAPTLRRYPIPFGVHGSLFADASVLGLLRQILTGAPPPTWLSARWSQEFMFNIFSTNTLVVEFRDEFGDAIPDADVTVTLDNGRPIALQRGGLLDYSLDVTMPGAGSRIRWKVEASAPNVAKMTATGILVASNN